MPPRAPCRAAAPRLLTLAMVARAMMASAQRVGSDTPVPLMNLTLVGGTHCLDGTPAGYYFRPASEARGKTRWVVYLEGGGLCTTPENCKSRTQTHLGSSKFWGPNRTGSASIAFNSASNPDFWDANHLFLPYCTGDLHTGTVNKTSISTYGLFFSGHINIVKIIAHALAHHPELRKAPDVLLTGDSAGGMGTFYNVDWLQDTLPWAHVRGAPVGGWFFSGDAVDQPLAPWAPPSIFPDWKANKTGTTQAVVALLVNLYRTYIHPNCADNEFIRFHCGTVHVFYKHIKATMFVLQNMYDTNQISGELYMPGCNSDTCSPQQRRFVEYFGASVRASTKQLVDNAKKYDGIFLPSCYAHCEGINVGGQTKINGFDGTSMLGDWFFNRVGRTPRRVVDDCPENLPCNPTCRTMVPEPHPKPETQCATELNTLCSRGEGCYDCAMLNLPQLLDALCTIDEISALCAKPPTIQL